MLGIGFHRDFVLSREGNPVLYVQNGDKGVLIENLVPRLVSSVPDNGKIKLQFYA